jgi:hypothetical protein
MNEQAEAQQTSRVFCYPWWYRLLLLFGAVLCFVPFVAAELVNYLDENMEIEGPLLLWIAAGGGVIAKKAFRYAKIRSGVFNVDGESWLAFGNVIYARFSARQRKLYLNCIDNLGDRKDIIVGPRVQHVEDLWAAIAAQLPVPIQHDTEPDPALQKLKPPVNTGPAGEVLSAPEEADFPGVLHVNDFRTVPYTLIGIALVALAVFGVFSITKTNTKFGSDGYVSTTEHYYLFETDAGWTGLMITIPVAIALVAIAIWRLVTGIHGYGFHKEGIYIHRLAGDDFIPARSIRAVQPVTEQIHPPSYGCAIEADSKVLSLKAEQFGWPLLLLCRTMRMTYLGLPAGGDDFDAVWAAAPLTTSAPAETGNAS